MILLEDLYSTPVDASKSKMNSSKGSVIRSITQQSRSKMGDLQDETSFVVDAILVECFWL